MSACDKRKAIHTKHNLWVLGAIELQCQCTVVTVCNVNDTLHIGIVMQHKNCLIGK